MKKIFALIAFLLGTATLTMAQNSMIKGKIWDETNSAPMMFANVSVDFGGTTIGTTTDDEGRFTLKLKPGTYNLELSFVGYPSQRITGVEVNPDKITFMNDLTMAIAEDGVTMDTYVVTAYKDKLIDPEDPSAMTIRSAELQATPAAKNPVAAVAMTTSDVKTDDSGNLYFRGARPEANGWWVDGQKANGSYGRMPGSSIGSMTVYAGGIPAKYGDVTGGVIVIETKSYFDLYNEWLATQGQR